MSVQKMDSTRDPQTMTTEERLDEIASILAVALCRVQSDTSTTHHTTHRGIDRRWRPTRDLQASSPQALEITTHADLSVSAQDPTDGPAH